MTRTPMATRRTPVRPRHLRLVDDTVAREPSWWQRLRGQRGARIFGVEHYDTHAGERRGRWVWRVVLGVVLAAALGAAVLEAMGR